MPTCGAKPCTLAMRRQPSCAGDYCCLPRTTMVLGPWQHPGAFRQVARDAGRRLRTVGFGDQTACTAPPAWLRPKHLGTGLPLIGRVLLVYDRCRAGPWVVCHGEAVSQGVFGPGHCISSLVTPEPILVQRGSHGLESEEQRCYSKSGAPLVAPGSTCSSRTFCYRLGLLAAAPRPALLCHGR